MLENPAKMDRRYDPRQLSEIDVRVTDLEDPQRSGSARMTDISKSGMGLAVPFALTAGDIIQIEFDDSTLFAIVVHGSSTPVNQDGSAWRAGVELQRVLMGGSGLSRLLQETLQQVLPQVPGVTVGEVTA